MCDYHGEESLSGGLAKEALLPPGRPAASPPRASLSARDLPAFLLPPWVGARPNPRCPLPSGTWRRASSLTGRRSLHRGAVPPPRSVPTGPGSSPRRLIPRAPGMRTWCGPTPRVWGSTVWARDVPSGLLPGPLLCSLPGGPAGRLFSAQSGVPVGGRKGGVSFLHILENYDKLSHQCFLQILVKRHVPRAEPLWFDLHHTRDLNGSKGSSEAGGCLRFKRKGQCLVRITNTTMQM